MNAAPNRRLMGVTFKQAVAAGGRPEPRFHYVGNAGHDACSSEIVEYRVNGRCKTWVTRPGHFRLPVKRGLRETTQIMHWNSDEWHLAEDCPELARRNEEAIDLIVGHRTGSHNADRRKPGWDEEE